MIEPPLIFLLFPQKLLTYTHVYSIIISERRLGR
nr:MAG TPA: hypothetical protein [Caudoviricetes sp.]